MKRLALLVFVVAATVSLAASDTPRIPAGAVGPLKKYAAAATAADLERTRAVDRARVVLVGELKGAQKAALERGDVDGATAIAELAKLNSQSLVRSDREIIAGTMWQRSLGDQITFGADGTIKFSDPKFGGTWAVIGEKTALVIWNHGYVDILKFDANGKAFKAISFKREGEHTGTAVR